MLRAEAKHMVVSTGQGRRGGPEGRTVVTGICLSLELDYLKDLSISLHLEIDLAYQTFLSV